MGLDAERASAAEGDLHRLPDGLPVPVDDGACRHLPGARLPELTLPSSEGDVELRTAAERRLVLYVYPRTGTPGRPVPAGWDDIPGARGCTPESCAFRDHAAELAATGTDVMGLSAQTLDEQVDFARRNRMPFPVVADPELTLARRLALPTFTFEGRTLYKRLTLVVEDHTVTHVFYPVFPPDRHADEVLARLREQGG